MVSSKISRPTTQDTWINIYPFRGNLEWDKIYTLPYKVSRKPFLQSFQFKIPHRILNSYEHLAKWKIRENSNCNYCNDVDTLEHHLIHCETSRLMWDRPVGLISDNLSINYNLAECEILFGIPFTNSIDWEIINFLMILFTKCFINCKKTLKSQIYFIEWLGEPLSSLLSANNWTKIN